jgi:hypothetical protein
MALYLAIGRLLRSEHGKQEVSGSSPDVGLGLFGFTEPNVNGLEIQTSAKSRLAGVHGFLAFLSRFPHR